MKLTPLAAALLTLASSALAQAAEAPPPSQLTLGEMVLSVGWVLLPLSLLSVGVLALATFNFFWLRRANVCTPLFYEDALRLLRDRKLEDLLALCKRETRLATAQLLVRAIEFTRANPGVTIEGLREISEAEGARLAGRIQQPNVLLLDLAVLGPLVGLLGTVIGILRSFGNLASDATPMKTMLLAGGVSQALVATSIGLIIGLFGMGFFAVFRLRVVAMVHYFEGISTEFLVKLQECLLKGRSTPTAP
jgi:biopolymer transport protein ExbB